MKGQWTKDDLRTKMMKVLVKSTKMTDTNIDPPTSDDDHQNGDDDLLNGLHDAEPHNNIDPLTQ